MRRISTGAVINNEKDEMLYWSVSRLKWLDLLAMLYTLSLSLSCSLAPAGTFPQSYLLVSKNPSPFM